MNRSKTETTSFNWDVEEKELTEENREHLEQEAHSRINEMTAEGYECGELCTILLGDEEEEEVYGWWSVS